MTNDTVDFFIQLATMPIGLIASIFGGAASQGGPPQSQVKTGTSTMGNVGAAQRQAATAVAGVRHTSVTPPTLPATAQQRYVMPSKPAPVTTVGKRDTKAPIGGSTFVLPPVGGGGSGSTAPKIGGRARFK